MKRISTKDMDDKSAELMLGSTLGASGNNNIRGCHLSHFEKSIIDNQEDLLTDISRAPNYYVWLALAVDHVFWHVRGYCFFQGDMDHGDYDLLYNGLIEKFYDMCCASGRYGQEELDDIYRDLIKVLEVRQLLVHRGFPNLLPVFYEDEHVRNKPAKGKGGEKEKFLRQDAEEIVSWCANPSNFHDVKAVISRLLSVVGSGDPVQVGF